MCNVDFFLKYSRYILIAFNHLLKIWLKYHSRAFKIKFDIHIAIHKELQLCNTSLLNEIIQSPVLFPACFSMKTLRYFNHLNA